MGVRFSHGGEFGSYGAFDRMRGAICRSIGGGWPPHAPEDLHKFPDPKAWYWENEDHPCCPVGVKMLLNCPDTFVSWNPAESMVVAYGLQEIQDRIPFGGAIGHLQKFGGYRGAVALIIRGLLQASDRNEWFEIG